MRLNSSTEPAASDLPGLLRTRSPSSYRPCRRGPEAENTCGGESKKRFQNQEDYLLSLGATYVFASTDNVAEKLAKEKQSLPILAFDFSGGSLHGLTVAKWLARDGKVVLVPAAAEIPAAHEKAVIPWNEILR